jgi:hypothetical protein
MITLMTQEESASETSVNTWRNQQKAIFVLAAVRT